MLLLCSFSLGLCAARSLFADSPDRGACRYRTTFVTRGVRDSCQTTAQQSCLISCVARLLQQD